jgi:hypothetical protein
VCTFPSTSSLDAISWDLVCVSVPIKKNANDESEHSQRGARWDSQQRERPGCKTRGDGYASVSKK